MKKQRLDAIAVVIQKAYRGFIARKRYEAMRNATVRIQALARGIMARRLAQTMRREKAALAIQSWGRMYIARRTFLETRSAVIRIQTGMYGKILLWRGNALTFNYSGQRKTSSRSVSAQQEGASSDQAAKLVPWAVSPVYATEVVISMLIAKLSSQRREESSEIRHAQDHLGSKSPSTTSS